MTTSSLLEYHKLVETSYCPKELWSKAHIATKKVQDAAKSGMPLHDSACYTLTPFVS
jgi:hypothetical protein